MTLKIGIIGTGWFSKMHTQILSILEGVQVQAVCGTSIPKATAFASEFGIVGCFDSVTDMLDAQRLDAVYICVPPMSHGEIELQLIERGIPFFIEKPVGLNMDLPAQILKQIHKKSLITSVGYHFRYTEAVRQMQQKLKSQEIGMITGQWMGDMPQVAWWRDQARSGGQFMEQTTHLVDLIRFCAGEIDEVYAVFGNNIMHKQFEGVTVADIGTVTMKLKSGVIANVSNTCILPEGVEKVGLTFYTKQGMLDWNTDRLEVIGLSSKSEFTNNLNPYTLENEAFIHAIRTGDSRLILSDYEEGVKTQNVTFTALESANKGVSLKINNEY